MSTLIPWQDEVLSSVLWLDVTGTRVGPLPSTSRGGPPSTTPLISLAGLLHPGAVSSPTALTDAGSQLLDSLICKVLSLPAHSRGGLSVLGYLLASFGRLVATEEVRGCSACV